ncbi:ATP-dependent DNA ligase [Streptomyces sp. JV176]|uniref:ATP-dependent DNA ligase n=1 Tax=Streptomyces sp. JV176 TaxID=858630 RepID=UPI003FA71C6B
MPSGTGWVYEPKFDGHRTILARGTDAVVLYTRSGRTVTPQWADLARAGKQVPPGTVLDGEAVIWRNGTIEACRSTAATAAVQRPPGRHPGPARRCRRAAHRRPGRHPRRARRGGRPARPGRPRPRPPDPGSAAGRAHPRRLPR